MKIFVKYGKNHLGPFTEQEVVDRFLAGQIPRNARMFSKEFGKWRKIKGHPALPFPKEVRQRWSIIHRKVFVAAAGIVALGLVFVAVISSCHPGGDKQLAAVAERMHSAVGVVVAEGFGADGKQRQIPFATAWAWKKDIFASNAHVVDQTMGFMERGFRVFVVLNRDPLKRYEVIGVSKHPLFRSNAIETDDGDVSFAYDVGLLRVAGKPPVHFDVAWNWTLRRLKSGDRVAYLGFPMENLVKGGVDVKSPVANMQSGIITAVSDFRQRDGGAKNNFLIRHNLGVAGGASGSPIFNSDGKVVAILNAGNMAVQFASVSQQSPEWVRTPSAVMINFAQRADLLEEVPPPDLRPVQRGGRISWEVRQANTKSVFGRAKSNPDIPQNGVVTVPAGGGRKAMVLNYRNSKLNGEQQVFAGNNKPLRIFNCVDGEMHGTDTFYDLDGGVRRVVVWEHGTSLGLRQGS